MGGEAVALLGELGGPRAALALEDLACEGPPTSAPRAAATFVRGGGDPLARITRLRDRGASEATLAGAREAVGGASDEVLAEVGDLARRLESDDVTTRATLAARLGATGLAGAVDPLVRLRADPSDRVSEAAVRALARIDPEGRIVLETILAKAGRNRLVAFSSLLREEPARATGHAPGLLEDRDPRIRAGALTVLATNAAADWAPFATRALGDDDPGVRRVADALLTKGEATEAVPALLRAYAESGPAGQAARIARIVGVRARRDFGHDPGLPPEGRRAVLERMEAWWGEESGE